MIKIWLESSSVEKALGALADCELNMSQWCALAAKRPGSILGCINRNMGCGGREGIILLGAC